MTTHTTTSPRAPSSSPGVTSASNNEAAVAMAKAAGVEVDEKTFGDLLAELLRTLPSDASALFLRSLSGLSPSESHDFCEHVAKLKPEKQFRVIHAMSEATLDGKRRFLAALAKKMAQQQQKQQLIQQQEEKDLEAHIKRKETLHAKERVKMMNPGNNKFHSFNAALGAGVAISKENMASNGSVATPATTTELTPEALKSLAASGPELVQTGRSLSSSSLQITKEDIKQMGNLLSNSHITESEMNLRELEISRKAFAASRQSTGDGSDDVVDMPDVAKRDRPDSIRDLIKSEQKPPQRSRGDDADSQQGTSEAGDDAQGNEGDESPGGDQQEAEDPEAPSTKRWTKMQDNALRESVRIHGEKNWKAIAELVPGRNHAQCLQRWRKVLKPGLVKGHWSFEEDQILEYLVTQGCNNWGQIAERIPGRTPKQCRERWKNHLDPAINKGPYTEDEDKIILDAQARLGNKWSQIAQLLKGRTEDSVKIRWKSLKQNPAKAAASHAQQKKAQQQQQQQQHHHHAAMAYAANPALLRQRQLQLLQQQQQLQNSEAAQLEHQQQLQQQQLQMRLQERLLHQQQLQRQAQQLQSTMIATSLEPIPMKPEPAASVPRVQVPGMTLPLSMQGARAPSPHLYAHPTAYTTAPQSFTQQLTGVDDTPKASDFHNGYDFNVQATSGFGYTLGGLPPQDGSPVASDDPRESADGWDLQNDLGDGFTRFGENPPPATFWDSYAKAPGVLPEPIPLSSQGTLPDPTSSSHFAVPEDEAYDDAMFEKLATELGSNTLHFAPL